MPKISVILPSLNIVDYIEQCIESVCNQTFYDIEIICVDAGSTDGTLEIIKKYAELDSRIVIINSDVRSYGYQVNLGIRKATGEYIGVVETDDYILENMYEILFNKAKEYDLDYIKGEYTNIMYLTKEKYYTYDVKTMSNIPGFEYNCITSYTECNDIIRKDFSIWRGIYKKSFLIDNNIWLNESAGAAYQDIGFVMQTAILAKKAMYTSEPFYQYRVNRPGCSTFNVNVLKYVNQEWQRLLEYILPQKNLKITDALLLRMQETIVGETNKLLELFKYNYLDEHITQYLPWLLNVIKIHNENHHITLLEPIEKMMNSIKDYTDEFKNQKEVFANKEKEIVQKAKQAHIVSILGAGKWGYYVYELMYKNQIKISYVYDNLKAGEMFAGHIIESPEKIQNKDELIIVANKFHYEDIKRQLIDLGINPNKIIEYKNF